MKVIAETAFNHNGNIDYLLKLIKESKRSGADFVTVQVMDTEVFCVRDYERYDIYIENEISKEDWIRVFDFCGDLDLDLIPCALEDSSFNLCYNYGFRLFKIHATDITNKSFLENIKSKGDCKVILETQCATNFDIRFALNILKENVECIIHGYSNYPTEVEELNLNALDFLQKEYKLDVGLADHSLDTIGIPVMALSKGVKYLEKHITLSRNNRNFDWQVSLYPEQFTSMVNTLKYYHKSLGKKIKHPSTLEFDFRNVLYKKYQNDNSFKRADSGSDYISYKFEEFDKNNIGIAIIARGNSQRLPRKIYKPFCDKSLIIDLYNRVSQTNLETYISTSTEESDNELVNVCKTESLNYFRGHPDSVLDRMLSLSFDKQFGGVFRVTGDNPFTDPEIINKMVNLFKNNDLDYVRCNGLPFGTTAELFSVKYLWNLYQKIDNPLETEYLSLFIINDDQCKKGCIEYNINDSIQYVNLSVDVEEDYYRCLTLLKKINRPWEQITIEDITKNVNLKDINLDKEVKLPSETIMLTDYIEKIKNLQYKIKINYESK
jgi:N,N'-diacetyllegionaminate synthase